MLIAGTQWGGSDENPQSTFFFYMIHLFLLLNKNFQSYLFANEGEKLPIKFMLYT